VNRTIKFACFIIIASGIGNWVLLFLSALNPKHIDFSLLWFLNLFLFHTGFLICLVILIITVRRFKWRSFIPIGIAIIFICSIWLYTSTVYGNIKAWSFKQNFEKYNQAATKILSQKEINNLSQNEFTWVDIYNPKGLPISGAYVSPCEDGTIIVYFHESIKYPAQRGGYIYISNDSKNPTSYFPKTWKFQKIKPNWYTFWLGKA
jgi:hypothetical protein